MFDADSSTAFVAVTGATIIAAYGGESPIC